MLPFVRFHWSFSVNRNMPSHEKTLHSLDVGIIYRNAGLKVHPCEELVRYGTIENSWRTEGQMYTYCL